MQCPYKPQPNVSATDTSCDCLNATFPSYILESLGVNVTFYADYGSQCGPHDADECDKFFPGADHAMWCCTSWCWVSESCPTARGSTLWPGHFWSEEHCELNAEAVSACKWESGWWFGTFLFFHILGIFGNNHPKWLIFFRGVETTNQICSNWRLLDN